LKSLTLFPNSKDLKSKHFSGKLEESDKGLSNRHFIDAAKFHRLT
jgi:hypothetical protein